MNFVHIVKAALISSILFVTGEGVAATFYVNNACAMSGTGQTPTCGVNGAWNSLAKAAECKGVEPGDIIEVRAGKGVYNEGWSWQPRCIGKPGKHIVIQNYPREEFVMEGTLDIRASDWHNVGNGVYLCRGDRCGTEKKFPFTAWYDRGAGEERLNLIQSNRACDSSVPAGTMRYVDNHVCVHLSDGSNPEKAAYFKIPYVYTAIQLNFVGASYLTLRSNPAGGKFVIRRYRDTGITTTTVNKEIYYEGLDIGWMMDRCIDQSEGGVTDAGYRIIGNRIHHCGQEGIRWSQDSSAKGRVEANEVYDIQTEPIFERCKNSCLSGFTDRGSAIRVAGNQNGVISRNVIHDIGGGLSGRSSGIDLEEGAVNTIVENNYLYRMNKGDLSNGHTSVALLLQTIGAEAYSTVIKNNYVYQADHCFSVDAGDTLPDTSSIDFRHNTCQDPRASGVVTGMSYPDIRAKVTMTNNTFSAVETTPRSLIDLTNARITGFRAPESNLFFCSKCKTLVYWGRNAFNGCDIAALGSGNDVFRHNLKATSCQ